jgi:putative endonuclease
MQSRAKKDGGYLMDNKILGNYGESLAANFLEQKGYGILVRNFKNKLGEVDLIAKDRAMIVFVEVKMRKSLSCGMPYESVSYYKQKKIIMVALSYLKLKFGTCDVLSRFDVISIYQNSSGQSQIEHLINAFDLSV